MTRNKIVLLGIVLLDVMSLGILIPVLPAIFQSMTLPLLVADPQINTIIWYSLIIGIHPICAFFSAPFLGALSDRLGRKWVLVVALVGTVIGYSLSIVGVQAASLVLLAIARLIDGGTSGNIAVARAALLDISPGEKRTEVLGVVGALFGLGMVIGPLVGGINWNVFGLTQASSTLVVAGFISLAALFATILFLRETKTDTSSATRLVRLLPRPEAELRPHIIYGMLYVAGFGIFTTYWALYLYSNFGMGPKDVALVFVFTGVCIALTQGIIVRFVAKFIRPKKVLSSSLPLFGLAVLLLAVVPIPYLYPALAWFCLWNGLTMANKVSFISSYSTKYGAGYVSGIDAAYTALASAVCPLLLSITALLGPKTPFIAIFILVMVGWWVMLRYTSEYRETDEAIVGN